MTGRRDGRGRNSVADDPQVGGLADPHHGFTPMTAFGGAGGGAVPVMLGGATGGGDARDARAARPATAAATAAVVGSSSSSSSDEGAASDASRGSVVGPHGQDFGTFGRGDVPLTTPTPAGSGSHGAREDDALLRDGGRAARRGGSRASAIARRSEADNKRRRNWCLLGAACLGATALATFLGIYLSQKKDHAAIIPPAPPGPPSPPPPAPPGPPTPPPPPPPPPVGPAPVCDFVKYGDLSATTGQYVAVAPQAVTTSCQNVQGTVTMSLECVKPFDGSCDFEGPAGTTVAANSITTGQVSLEQANALMQEARLRANIREFQPVDIQACVSDANGQDCTTLRKVMTNALDERRDAVQARSAAASSVSSAASVPTAAGMDWNSVAMEAGAAFAAGVAASAAARTATSYMVDKGYCSERTANIVVNGTVLVTAAASFMYSGTAAFAEGASSNDYARAAISVAAPVIGHMAIDATAKVGSALSSCMSSLFGGKPRTTDVEEGNQDDHTLTNR